MGLGSPSPRPFHMVSLSFWPGRVGMGQPLLFLFLLAGKRPNQHIWEIRVDYRRNLPNVGIEVPARRYYGCSLSIHVGGVLSLESGS